MEPVSEGLYIGAIDGRARGVFHIRDGRRAAPAPDAQVDVDPLALLAGAQALTAGQRTILAGTTSPREAGATVCPALRTTRGLRIRP